MVENQGADTVRPIPSECVVRIPPWIWYLVALSVGVGLQRIVPLEIVSQTVHSLIGWIVLGSGMALLAWSELMFSRHKTSHDHKSVASALITTGPFRFSRNPVYLGMSILLAGIALTLNIPWLLLTAPLALLVMQFHVVPKEEACLEQLFPEAYPRYCQSVRRWL